MGKCVGIDLGTTYSAISYVDEKGNAVMIHNEQGHNTTPSVVLFGEEKPCIGSVAKKKSIKDPQNYEAFAKRHMGEKTYVFTSKNGEKYKAEEISAYILKKLKMEGEKYMGCSIDGAVITVPAYFGDPQRRATIDAATMAGIEVLDIINEPTAAAIAFGVNKNVEEMQRVMVYDFGGGTFDVSILEIDNSNIKVIATNGDHKLGGYDVDVALYEYVKQVVRENGVDVDSDVKASHNLMLQIEEAKKELSYVNSTEVSFYVKGEDVSVKIDREMFEDLIESIVYTTISVMQKTIDEADLNYEDIDKILLVGGSTRIPFVRSIIEEETGIKPSFEVHPDEAVAMGAAYHAVEMAKSKLMNNNDSNLKNDDVYVGDTVDIPELSKNYKFKDITSHGIGIVVYDSELNVDANSVILDKNTELPAEVIQDGYSTSEPYQEEIELQVTQGEHTNLDYVTIIGSAVLKVRPRDYNVPIRIVVSCDSGAIIHVRAFDMDENVDLGEVTINRDKHNMTEEEIKIATKRINKLNIGD